MSLPEHDRFADDAQRYALVSRIATGGMGEVWRGRDTVLGREVAVKVLKAEYADDATFRARFETEARHAASLHHPGIASVFDFGEAAPAAGSSSPRPYLVMELVEGQPLSNLLRPGAPLDPDVTRDLVAQTAAALGVAHAAGIVHRDVKPGNLIVTPDRRVKVTDFGIARAAEGMSLTETGQVMGTPAYLSPEQAEGGTASAASDVYSLAVVAFECLAGRKPFLADTPVATALAHLREPVPELPGDVPTGLAAVVRRALAKDPAQRYPDGQAFAAALRDPAAPAAVAPTAPEPTTQVLPAVAPTPPAAPRSHLAVPPADADEPRRGAPRWLPWLILLAVLAVGALVGGVALWQGLGDDDTGTPDRTPSQSPTTTPDKRPSESPTKTPTQSPESPSDTPSPSESPTTETVQVDEADYLGSDVAAVEQALRAAGLEVSRTRLDNPGDEVENTVAAVNPTGTLEEGALVTVSFWGPAPPPDQTETPLPTDGASTQ